MFLEKWYFLFCIFIIFVWRGFFCIFLGAGVSTAGSEETGSEESTGDEEVTEAEGAGGKEVTRAGAKSNWAINTSSVART